MTEVSEVYLCEICGNKVKVLESGPGQLVCCGEPMKKVE
ncbi:desulfoferrodoxin FeS4 iron-binding domain-containing protein [archaeon]|nr:desulfoferrodoxin FeS4 iron-binding domain-containing protein [archaeon]